MSRQLLVVVKCNNNKDIVRGIYNSKNSELDISNFTNEDINNLKNEVEKVLNKYNFKSIKFYYSSSDSKNNVIKFENIYTSNCYNIKGFLNLINDYSKGINIFEEYKKIKN